MAVDTKISALPPLATLSHAAEFPVVSGGVTYKAATEQIVDDLLHPAHGEIYITTPVTTTVVSVGVPVKVAGLTTAGGFVTQRKFDMPSDGRLRYTNTPLMPMHITCSISFTVESNNQIVAFYLTRDGVLIPSSKLRRKVGTGADVGSLALHAAATLTTNQYVELWLENETSTANVAVEQMNLFAMGMHV